MNWYVIRHPETGGVGVVADAALPIHRGAGWLRVSDAISDMDRDHLVLTDYASAPDLDAPKPEPTDAKTAAKTSSKEN